MIATGGKRNALIFIATCCARYYDYLYLIYGWDTNPSSWLKTYKYITMKNHIYNPSSSKISKLFFALTLVATFFSVPQFVLADDTTLAIYSTGKK